MITKGFLTNIKEIIMAEKGIDVLMEEQRRFPPPE